MHKADEPKGDTKAYAALGHEVFQLHSVFASPECEKALRQEGIVSGTKRMVAGYHGMEASPCQLSVCKVCDDVGISDHPRHCSAAMKDDVRTCAAKI